jgi:hypothetical protein
MAPLPAESQAAKGTHFFPAAAIAAPEHGQDIVGRLAVSAGAALYAPRLHVKDRREASKRPAEAAA